MKADGETGFVTGDGLETVEKTGSVNGMRQAFNLFETADEYAVPVVGAFIGGGFSTWTAAGTPGECGDFMDQGCHNGVGGLIVFVVAGEEEVEILFAFAKAWDDEVFRAEAMAQCISGGTLLTFRGYGSCGLKGVEGGWSR